MDRSFLLLGVYPQRILHAGHKPVVSCSDVTRHGNHEVLCGRNPNCEHLYSDAIYSQRIYHWRSEWRLLLQRAGGRCAPLQPRVVRSEERRVGSDWSSDVCSSDLTPIQRRHLFPADLPLAQRMAPTPSTGRWTMCASTTARCQIGRASCRE